MTLSPATLKELQSYVLQLQLKIANGESRANAKTDLYRLLSQEGRRDLADLLLTFEAVLGERAGMPEKPSVNIYGGTFANLNFGEQLGTINATAQVIEKASAEGKRFADALRAVAEAVNQDQDLKVDVKKEALKALQEVGAQAEQPAEKRQPAVFNGALSHLPTLLSTTAAGIKIWEAWGAILISYFSN